MLEQHTTTHTHHVIYGKRSIYHLTLSFILLLQQNANVLYFLETNGERKFWISLTSIQDIQCIKGTYFDDLTFYKHDGNYVC